MVLGVLSINDLKVISVIGNSSRALPKFILKLDRSQQEFPRFQSSDRYYFSFILTVFIMLSLEQKLNNLLVISIYFYMT